jgi:hypothetical protein
MTARGAGYLVANPHVVEAVDTLYPHAAVAPDGSWRAAPRPPPPARVVPVPWGRDAFVYCSDRRFFPGLVASLRSLLAWHPDAPVVVISWDLAPVQEAYLRGFATVVPREPDLPEDPAWGRFGLFRLDLRRAVYLDADTVVLGPLHELLAADAAFAAAPNLDWTLADNFCDPRPLTSLRLDPALPAFNSGVFTAHVSAWGPAFLAELLDLQARFGTDFLYPDQSALQLALNRPGRRFTWLPPRLNAMAEFWDWTDPDRLPALVHYAGHEKPWRPDCPYPAQHFFFRWSKIPAPAQLPTVLPA